jgi:hypothetical protein
MIERLRAWTFERHKLGHRAPLPIDALRGVIAVYSSHPTAPLSLACRSVAFAPDSIAAMEEQRRVVRIPAMRGSIFLAPIEHAANLLAATRLPLEKFAGRLAYAGVTLDEYAKLKPKILKALREPLKPEELLKAIRTNARVAVIVRAMSFEGLTLRLSTSLRTDKLRYVSTEAWLGQPLGDADPEQALTWLGREYLRAFGPARIADFAWWSGVTRRRAAAALARLDTVDVAPGLLLLREDTPDFARIERSTGAALVALPKWDALTMGYAPDGRQRLIEDKHLPLAYSTAGEAGATSGDGKPLLLRDGRAVASWSHRFERDRLLIEVTRFESRGGTQKLCEAAFEDAGVALGAATISVTVHSVG